MRETDLSQSSKLLPEIFTVNEAMAYASTLAASFA